MKRHRSFRMSRAAQAVGDRLLSSPGLIGVFWGTPPGRRGQPSAPEVVVHLDHAPPVSRSIEAQEMATDDDVRVSVIDVPLAGQHAVSCAVPVRGDDLSRGRSSISAIALVGGTPHLLVSGHGTLPLVGGELPGLYKGEVPAAVVSDGGELRGALLSGRLDATSDFALARVLGGKSLVDLFHDTAQAIPPIIVRTEPIARDAPVSHVSAIRDRTRIEGSVLQVSHKRIMLPGVGGKKYPYRNVLVAASNDPDMPFSVGGDSGSLVVDGDNRAVGLVIGGDESRNLSYVLPLDAMLKALRTDAAPFFVKEES